MVSILDFASASAGGTNWSPALIAAFADSLYVEIPNDGTPYPFATPVTIPEFGELRGQAKPVLTFAGDGLTQLKHSTLSNVIVEGPGRATSTTGLNISGDHQVTEKVVVRQFGIGWQGNNPNTYITTSRDCTYAYCGTAVSMWLDGSLTAGEKILFDGCTFANSDVLFRLRGSFLDTFFIGCSFDYCVDYGELSNGQHHFIGGHIETSANVTTQGFLLRKTNGAQVEFMGVRFGMVGVPYVVDRTTEGTSGYVRYTNCPSNSLQAGTASSFVSRSAIYHQLAAGTREATLHTPFASRTAFPSVSMSGMTANPARPLASPSVTFDPASTAVTVSLPVAQPNAVGVLIDFG